MMTLTLVTWTRFLAWFAIGLVIYSVYGIKNSVENEQSHNQVPWFPCLLKRNTVAQKNSGHKEKMHLPTISEEITLSNKDSYNF